MCGCKSETPRRVVSKKQPKRLVRPTMLPVPARHKVKEIKHKTLYRHGM